VKKILFVHPNLIARGAEKVLVDLLNTIDKTKYDITLFTFFEEGIHKERLSKDIKHKFLFKKIFRGWSVLQKIVSPQRLFKLLIKDDYDIMVAYLEGVPTRLVGGCTNPKTKLIAWVHVDLRNFGIEKVFRSPEEMKTIYHQFDKVVGVSKTAINALATMVDLPSSKKQGIHNVVDTASILQKGNEEVTELTYDQGVKLVSVGSLTRQKGYQRLFKIVNRLKQDGLQFHIYIVGKGDEEQVLQAYSTAHDLSSHITLLGFTTNPHKYVRNCDVFVCSSFEEGFSTAVTEAVVLGTPVITTDCSGMDEILDDGNYGIIVENNEDSLYKGLYDLLTNAAILEAYKNKTAERSLYFQNKNNVADVEAVFDAF